MIYNQNQTLRFRAAEREDIPMWVGWLNDPEVRQGIAQILPFSIPIETEWFEKMIKEPREQQVMVIEIQENDRWISIGNCGFMNFDWRNRSAEFGIMIGAKAYWNQGHGSETVRLLVKFGFETLNLHRIWLRVFANNPRAIRAYEKAGFVHEGYLRQAEFIQGEYVDVLMMSVLRPEWKA